MIQYLTKFNLSLDIMPRTKKSTTNIKKSLLQVKPSSDSIEFLLGLSSAMFTTPFVKDTAWYYHPVTTTAMMLMLNALFRKGADAIIAENNEPPKYLKPASRFICSYLYATNEMLTKIPMIHEFGHLIATDCLFKDARPEIAIFPPYGGHTFSNNPKSELSALGEQLGLNGSHAGVYAGGPAAHLLFTCGTYIRAKILEKNNPEIASHLLMTAFFSTFQLVNSAYNNDHDFSHINESTGISATMSASFIIGITMLLQLLLLCINRDEPKPREITELDEIEHMTKSKKHL